MLIQYGYLKQRSQYGKQCIFEETDPVVEVNIQPQPKFMERYVRRRYCHRGVQNCKQLALHKVRKPNCKSFEDINSYFLDKGEDSRRDSRD